MWYRVQLAQNFKIILYMALWMKQNQRMYNFRPANCHIGKEGEWMYTSTLALTLALDLCRKLSPPSGRFTPPGMTPVPFVQEAGWAPEPVWTGAGKLVRTGIGFSDRPACNESLYWMRYPGPRNGLHFHVLLNIIDMRRLTTGLPSEKCVVRQFRRCAKVYLHKPR
jgi:hypothetical protein